MIFIKKNLPIRDKDFIRKCLGRLEMATSIQHAYLMQLARDKNSSLMERAYAVSAAYKIVANTTKIYQSLGLLNLEQFLKEQANNPQRKNCTKPKELTDEQLERMERNIQILRRHRERMKQKSEAGGNDSSF